MRKKPAEAKPDIRDELARRDTDEQAIRKAWRATGAAERDLIDAVDRAKRAFDERLADAAITGDETVVTAARNAFYEAQIAAHENQSSSRALHARPEAHKNETPYWCDRIRNTLNQTLRGEARQLAKRKAELLRELAEVDDQAEALRLTWQRVEDGTAYAAGRSRDEVVLDADTLTPVVRGDAPELARAPVADIREDTPPDVVGVWDAEQETTRAL